MTRSTFKMEDVTRAAKAVTKAGLPIARVEINPDGKIIIIARDQAEHGDDEGKDGGDEWDRA